MPYPMNMVVSDGAACVRPVPRDAEFVECVSAEKTGVGFHLYVNAIRDTQSRYEVSNTTDA